MIRRWLIRALALSLLTLCVVAWVGSYWKGIFVQHDGTDDWAQLKAVSGHVYGGWAKHIHSNSTEWRWGSTNPLTHAQLNGWPHNPEINCLGFVLVMHHESPKWPAIEAHIPLWFPTLLSALLLWLVWRKTRPTYNGRGFPVEVVKKAEG